jgi:hypothetical protein
MEIETLQIKASIASKRVANANRSMDFGSVLEVLISGGIKWFRESARTGDILLNSAV